MKYLPVIPELERITDNLSPMITTQILRSIIAYSKKKEFAVLIQATRIVSIVSTFKLINGGIK